MTLRPWLGGWSTYTAFGLIGYVVAAITIGLLGHALGLSVAARLVTVVMPAIGFLIAVSLARLVTGQERIVFYQASFAAWSASCIVAWFTAMPVAHVSDLVIVLVAICLAFGRIGCLHVACCHGRPSRIGVRYSESHVRLGFPRRWLGRRIFPVQVVESLASAGLAVACVLVILGDHRAGTATCLYVAGYALVRFPLELARGDAARPYYRGLSEAQWIALATTALALMYRPSATLGVAMGTLMVMAIITRIALHGALAQPRHLDEIERTFTALMSTNDPTAAWTSCGLKLSSRPLPDGTLDLVCSHATLTREGIEQVAAALFARSRVLPGTTGGLFHVLVRRDDLR